MNPNPLEKDIEKKIGDYTKKHGGLYWKFVSPANPSVPDRIIVFPGDRVGWLELKRKGQKPTPKQFQKLAELESRGCTVGWVDNVEDGKRFVDKIMKPKQTEEDWV